MTNRIKLASLVAFTLFVGILNGCDNTEGEPDNTFRPGDFGGSMDPQLASMEPSDVAGALDLTAPMGDQCDANPDSWGCPGMPCVHGACWDGDGWISDSCDGTIRADDGTIVDPGTCE